MLKGFKTLQLMKAFENNLKFQKMKKNTTYNADFLRIRKKAEKEQKNFIRFLRKFQIIFYLGKLI